MVDLAKLIFLYELNFFSSFFVKYFLKNIPCHHDDFGRVVKEQTIKVGVEIDGQ